MIGNMRQRDVVRMGAPGVQVNEDGGRADGASAAHVGRVLRRGRSSSASCRMAVFVRQCWCYRMLLAASFVLRSLPGQI